jgi:hypothetical protein
MKSSFNEAFSMSLVLPVMLMIFFLVQSSGQEYLSITGNAQQPSFTIDSDSELIQMALSNGWLGNGSEENPFVISNLTINTNGAANCVFIGNTTMHLIINDLVVEGAINKDKLVAQGSGIALFNAMNVTVNNCSSMNNQGMGISVIGCQDILIKECLTSGNGRFGITIQNSINMSIIRCNVDSENSIGIDVYGVRHTIMENCSISRISSTAIQMRGDNTHLKIIGSNLTSSGIGLLTTGNLMNLDLDDCLVKGNRYGINLNGGSNIDINGTDIIDCETAILARNLDNLSVMETILTNGNFGINSINVTMGRIADNFILGYYIGILLTEGCQGMTIEDNLIAWSTNYGIRLTGAKSVSVFNNSFFYNSGTGDNLRPDRNQVEDDSMMNLWSMNHFRDMRWPDADRDGEVDIPYNDTSGLLDNRPRALQKKPLLVPPSSLSATSVRGGIHLDWDVVDGANSYRVFRASSADQDPIPIMDASNVSVIDSFLTNENIHYFWLCSIGPDGIPSDLTAPINGRADREGPIVSILEPIDGAFLNDDPILVIWSAYDMVTDVATNLLFLDDSKVSGTSKDGPFLLKRLEEGVHRLTIMSEDINGNICNDSITFTIDRTSPILTIDYPVPGFLWNNNEIPINWSVEDQLSPIISLRYRLDQGNWSVTSVGRANISGLSEGEHKIDLMAFDAANNIQEVTVSFTIDTKPPKIIAAEPRNLVRDLSTAIEVQFDEVMNTSSLRMEVEGHSGNVLKKNKYISFEIDGGLKFGSVYNVWVYGQDLAGNEVELHWSFTTIDDVGALVIKVVDAQNHPIPYVSVFEEGRKIGISGQDGHIYIRLSSGYHEIELNVTGYESMSVTALIRLEGITDLGIVHLEKKHIAVPGWIHIRVLDSRGHPKEGAQVYMDGLLIDITNDEGWLLIKIGKGMYTFYAEYNRFRTIDTDVNVSIEGYNETLILTLLEPEKADPKSNQNLPFLIMIPVLILSVMILLLLKIKRNSRARSASKRFKKTKDDLGKRIEFEEIID